jgi:glutamate N-acetyltransferase/amino-acid N-acetyltransferase
MIRQKESIPFKVINANKFILPEGFLAGCVCANIKSSKKPDCGIIISQYPCNAAGVFTTNKVRASSVEWTKNILPSNQIYAVFANSGNANACTGKRGMNDTKKIADMIARKLKIKQGSVCIASTGVIGHFLPIKKITAKIPRLINSATSYGGSNFSFAIMTTDTKSKEISLKVKTNKGSFIISGCAKGSGMIHPNLATMLVFITTDAKISHTALNRILKNVTQHTFNNLTVDGDTSTNDMVLLLANGASQIVLSNNTDLAVFEEALYYVCNDLCKKIAEDGEGATKRVEIRIYGARTYLEAKRVAKSIANSNLVKTAIFGNDPNWGRILCAIGYSNVHFVFKKLSLYLCNVCVFKNGRPLLSFSAKDLSNKMKKSPVIIEVNLGAGKEKAIAHTCDLTYDYIKINADYHT